MQIRSITAPNPGPYTLDGTRSFILGETAVIDPGPAIDSHVEAILAMVPRLEMILITHRHADHAPAAPSLRERSGAAIVAPHGVLEDSVVSRRNVGGEMLDVAGETLHVIATPGHTREHVCFMTRDGDLFTGDTILGSGTTAVFPPDGDMADYLDSLAVLRALAPRRIHPAHGPTRDDAVQLIDQYIQHRLERERQIVGTLAQGSMDVIRLREAIYPDLDPRIHRAAEAQLLAHLIKLQREGKVEERDGRFARSPEQKT
jgi:glyoxylase-like metal-dependent hydrolase (beta-lactamase superfamily II)